MPTKTRRFLRLLEVQHLVPYSRSTIYLKIAQGNFPKPFNLGARAVAWLESDIEEWIERQVEKADAQAGAPRNFCEKEKVSMPTKNFGPVVKFPGPALERAALGSVLLDNRILLSYLREHGIQPDSFSDDRNRRIFLCMLMLLDQHRPIDIVSVCETATSQLVKHGICGIGGVDYLSRLIDDVPSGG